MSDLAEWEAQLNSFDPAERQRALERLAEVPLSAPATENVNLHCHSFFSFNADGWSPSRIAWEARKAGLYAAGLCDFDVLDGVDEFLDAGERLGLRATANLETRAFLPEYAEVEISSPGEPGVTYIMGAGFVRQPDPGTPQADGLALFRAGARARNLALIQRINPHLPEIAVDYERDVLPLTPKGVATERHIVRAYLNRAKAVCGTPHATAAYWSRQLGKSASELLPLLDTPAMEEMVRARLAKRGGIGYVQPSEKTFPPVDEFIAWVSSCQALPMITWLDGTSEGEKDPRALLECLAAKGALALNIIPDRNWNIPDPAQRAIKVANLRAVVALADEMGLPINIGTEMNRAGLPFVDDLSGPVLREFRHSFLRGAQIMVGHSVCLRYAGFPYAAHPGGTRERNDFFASVGALPPLTRPVAARLQEMGPQEALRTITNSAQQGRWYLGT
ncbi:MAG: hypothetical protein QHJ73_08155 [Armatimonadota bacterium]|nr:hypothetical protein [Armatimonadota bacterium]